MTPIEFSNQFDVLYNNVTSNQAPGLNEYEKSVFLTQAQAQLVRENFNTRMDSVGGGFDGSQKRQYDFSCLLRTASLFPVNTFSERITDDEKIDHRSIVYVFPDNYFLSVNEILSDKHYQYSVLPIDYAEYQKEMLKPYAFPVKRGAWRLITDKKNCNVYRSYVKDAEGNDSEADYSFVSTWADQKRNLEITIQAYSVNVDEVLNADYQLPTVTKSSYYFESTVKDGLVCRIDFAKNWSDDKLTYIITLKLYANDDLDDEEVIIVIREGMQQYTDRFHDDNTWTKIIRHTDGFRNASAPSQFEQFTIMDSNLNGMTFKTHVEQLPMVEIIGKFKQLPTYQMRYVRTLKPIILEDLDSYGDDVTIEGLSKITPCELPKETHEEILQRAVALAKLAWQGGNTAQTQVERSR